MDASGEREERGGRAGRADRTGRGSAAAGQRTVRKWAVTGGWLCAIVAAVLVGAWSFQNANPDAGYASHGPLDEADVREELDGGAGATGGDGRPGGDGPSRRPPGERPSAPPSSPPAGPPDGSDDASDAADPKPPSDGGARPVPLEIPGGGATGTVQCLDDGRIRLTGLSPADGYRVDDVVHGPGRLVSFELKPPDDGEDETGGEADDHAAVRSTAVAGELEDRIVSVRCRGGEPVTSVAEES